MDQPLSPSVPLDLPKLFPRAFNPDDPRPLQRGIRRDLMRALDTDKQQQIPGVHLTRALAFWYEMPEYLRSLVAGAERIGLDGQPCGEIVKAREAREAARLIAHPLPLWLLYPACFDPAHPRPLKVGIRADLIAEGHDPAAVHLALWRYTQKALYQLQCVLGAVRVDLRGQPAGLVEAARVSVFAPDLPRDLPVNLEDTVPGRLELTLKFNEMPKARQVRDGYRIGVRAGKILVVATLRPRVWRKLEQAQADWPHWVAMLAGQMGAQSEGADGPVLILEQPNLQVFKKKPRVKAAAEVREVQDAA